MDSMYHKVFDPEFQAAALLKRKALSAESLAEEERLLAEVAESEDQSGLHTVPDPPERKKTKAQLAAAADRAKKIQDRLDEKDANKAREKAGEEQQKRSLEQAAAGRVPEFEPDLHDPRHTGKRQQRPGDSAGGAKPKAARTEAAGAGAGASPQADEEEEQEELQAEAGPPQRRGGDDEEPAGRPYDGHEEVHSVEKDLNKWWALYADDKATARRQKGELKWHRTKVKFFEALDQVIVLYQERVEDPEEDDDSERSAARLAAYQALKLRLEKVEVPGALNFDAAFTEELKKVI